MRDVRHHPRQHDGGDDRRHEPEPHLGERERRRLGRDDDVAGGEQPHAAGPGRPADDGDHRLRRAPDRLEQVGELAHALVLRAAAGRLGEVHPGAEHPAGVVEHDHPHGVVGEGVGEGLAQLGPQGPGERVAVGGGVQGQRRDAARHLHLHHSVGGHSRILPGGGGRAAHWEQMNTVLPLLETPAAAASSCPTSARDGLTTTPFGLYVHVPFCATRCGYCDFNTYTSDELGPGANRAEYAGTAIAELRRAADTLGPDLPDRLDRLRRRRHPDPAARPTTSPPSWPPPATCSRWPTTSRSPPRPTRSRSPRPRWPGCARPASPGSAWACSPPPSTCSPSWTAGTRPAGRSRRRTRPAPPGFEHVNLDLIYGAPGETDADWAASLDAVLAGPVDHVSAPTR